MPTPRLDERDAQALARHIVHELKRLGAHVTQFGVHLEREGFYFRANVNGKDVWVQTGQGNFRYDRIAAELLHASTQVRDDTLEILKESVT
jgi:hypothetical protein